MGHHGQWHVKRSLRLFSDGYRRLDGWVHDYGDLHDDGVKWELRECLQCISEYHESSLHSEWTGSSVCKFDWQQLHSNRWRCFNVCLGDLRKRKFECNERIIGNGNGREFRQLHVDGDLDDNSVRWEL